MVSPIGHAQLGNDRKAICVIDACAIYVIVQMLLQLIVVCAIGGQFGKGCYLILDPLVLVEFHLIGFK
jgi:hypothetical protein